MGLQLQLYNFESFLHFMRLLSVSFMQTNTDAVGAKYLAETFLQIRDTAAICTRYLQDLLTRVRLKKRGIYRLALAEIYD